MPDLILLTVMPGPSDQSKGRLAPGIHVVRAAVQTWMAGTSPAMTSGRLQSVEDL